ncbi:hypothetical protein Tco_0969924 [Tanacetum coccineum]
MNIHSLQGKVIEQVAARSGMDSKMVELLSFKLDVLDFGTCIFNTPNYLPLLYCKNGGVTLAEEKDILLEAKDKEIEDLKSQLLKAKEESAEVAQLRAQVSGLEATENSLRGEVASAQDHNVLLEQECNSLKFKVTGLESTIAEKDHELSELGASSSSLKSQNQSLVNQVHELEISSTDLREKLEMYEGSLKQLEEFQDNLMGPLRTSGLKWDPRRGKDPLIIVSCGLGLA